MNVDVKLSFLKLIYGTWLVEIAKEINRVLLKTRNFSDSASFLNQSLSVVMQKQNKRDLLLTVK